jgi:hypothetical protein
LINASVIIIIRGHRFCLWGSVYLDAHGEEDRDLRLEWHGYIWGVIEAWLIKTSVIIPGFIIILFLNIKKSNNH